MYIRGRKSRFIKIVGKRISLDEVEKLLESNYSDVECVVAGEDEYLIVYTTEEKIRNMEQFLCQALGIHRKFLQVHSIKEIPHNKAGKVRYQQLSKTYY